MKHFFLGLLLVLVTVVLQIVVVIGSFYGEEDWRGHREWLQAKIDIEKAGWSLDPASCVSPPVPDSQNLAALPVFTLSPDPENPRARIAAKLEQALEPVHRGKSNPKNGLFNDLPYLGDNLTPYQLDNIRDRLVALGRELQPPLAPPAQATLTDIFEQLCPLLGDLRRASVRCPFCRFDSEDQLPPNARIYGGLGDQLYLARTLAYEGRLALVTGNSRLALDNLHLATRFISGMEQQPFLVAQLHSIAMTDYAIAPIRHGIVSHTWSASDLDEIEKTLSKFDLLKDGQFGIHSQVTFLNVPRLQYQQHHRYLTLAESHGLRHDDSFDLPTWPDFILRKAFYFFPNGWFDLDAASYARFHLLHTLTQIDPETHRVFPDKTQPLEQLARQSIWHIPPRNTMLPVVTLSLRSVSRFARSQTLLDETLIACELEKYRLTNHFFPASLADLPGAVDLPHDVVNGQPYHYQLKSDGTFLLYSVGWDQIDDGGQPAAWQSDWGFAQNASGDWIW